MRALKDIWLLLVELFLLVVGIVVFSLVAVTGFVYTLFKHVFVKGDYAVKKQLLPIIRQLNLCFDGFANAWAGEMLNDTLKIKGNVKYGKWYHTISAVTGILYLNGKDTKLRRLLDKVLDKEHCIKSITDEQRKYYLT